MKLQPGAFNAFLNGIGQQFLWRRAYACPCINPNSGASKPSCPLCGGKGRQWDTGLTGTAGVPNASPRRVFAQFGQYEPGDAMLTIGSDSPLYAMGQFDRIVSKNSAQSFSESLTGGQNDKLYWSSILQIERVFWLDPTGTTVIPGGIPTVNADGSLTWSTGAPPAGTVYSITGEKYDEWFCYGDLPSNRNEHSGAALPRKAHLRRFDLFGR
jgi:hypothetical protein